MLMAERFPYINAHPAIGEAGFRPFMLITLMYQQSLIATSALLDTGATVNVLPYPLGLELGYVWERQTASLNLTGNLAQYEARVVTVDAGVGRFEPTRVRLDKSCRSSANFGTGKLLYGV